MKPYQQRCIDEKKELDERIQKLDQFLKLPDTRLGQNDRRDMELQLWAMMIYTRALANRIGRF